MNWRLATPFHRRIRDDHGQDLGMKPAELDAQLDARHPGHSDVGDDDVDRARSQFLQATGRRMHRIGIKAMLAKRVAHQLRDVLIIVHH